MEKLQNSLRRVMWERVGIIRNRDGLFAALSQLSDWDAQLKGRCRARRDWEIQNMVTVSRLVATAALQRENSLGAHFRSDSPEGLPAGWDRHIQLGAKVFS
jgi:L-aspartate oxidase